jgi:hypothetical protein
VNCTIVERFSGMENATISHRLHPALTISNELGTSPIRCRNAGIRIWHAHFIVRKDVNRIAGRSARLLHRTTLRALARLARRT